MDMLTLSPIGCASYMVYKYGGGKSSARCLSTPKCHSLCRLREQGDKDRIDYLRPDESVNAGGTAGDSQLRPGDGTLPFVSSKRSASTLAMRQRSDNGIALDDHGLSVLSHQQVSTDIFAPD